MNWILPSSRVETPVVGNVEAAQLVHVYTQRFATEEALKEALDLLEMVNKLGVLGYHDVKIERFLKQFK